MNKARASREYNTPFGRWYTALPFGAAAELARRAGIPRQYLSALATGARLAGLNVASALLGAANDPERGQIGSEPLTLAILRPDRFE